MWQRFSQNARKVVFYAQEEAQRFGEGYVGTEHLLLGILRVEEGAAARAIRAQGVRIDQVKSEVERLLSKHDLKPSQDMTLTPEAKRVIGLAYNEAREVFQHDTIGTEHLLLGLIADEEGLAAQALRTLGIDAERVREEARAIDAQEPGRHKPPEPPKRVVTKAPPPPDPWAGIDLAVRRAAFFAELEALRRGQGFVSTEHLLLGLLREGEGPAVRLLVALGLDPEAVRDAAWDACRDAGAPLKGEAILSAAANHAFTLAYEEQTRCRAAETGADHLLLGLLREPDGMAARILEGMGLDVATVRIRVLAREG